MSLREHRTANGIAWYEIGPASAPPFVACHGMALDHRDLRGLMLAAAGNRRVIMWDMPGHGASAPMSEPCSLGSMTDALEAVLDDAAAQAPILLGFSFGGMVTQELLKRSTRSVQAAIAFGCYAPFLVPAPLTADAVEQVLLTPLRTASWDLVRDGFVAACSSRPAVQEVLRPAVDRCGRDGLLAMTRALFDAFVPVSDYSINVPLLVMRGVGDANGAALAQSAQSLIAAAKNAHEVIISDAGHCAHLDQPAQALVAVKEFLKSC